MTLQPCNKTNKRACGCCKNWGEQRRLRHQGNTKLSLWLFCLVAILMWPLRQNQTWDGPSQTSTHIYNNLIVRWRDAQLAFHPAKTRGKHQESHLNLSLMSHLLHWRNRLRPNTLSATWDTDKSSQAWFYLHRRSYSINLQTKHK